jgi:thiosulfate sulfurtransferase
VVRRATVAELAQLLADGQADVVDIRDTLSFQAGHVPGARLLNNDNLPRFLADADRARTLVVCCYSGNSSVGAAQFLAGEGFTDVRSLDGGYTAWQYNQPVERS